MERKKSGKKTLLCVGAVVAAVVVVTAVAVLSLVLNFFGKLEMTDHLQRKWYSSGQFAGDFYEGDDDADYVFRLEKRGFEGGYFKGNVINANYEYGTEYEIKSGSKVEIGADTYKVKFEDRDKNGVIETMIMNGKGPLAGEWTSTNEYFYHMPFLKAEDYFRFLTEYMF